MAGDFSDGFPNRNDSAKLIRKNRMDGEEELKSMGEREKFPVGIIGGTGGMGGWFARFFSEEGYPVLVSGRKEGPDLPEMTEECPVVIVSVPIGVTCEVIRKVGPLMKADSLLMDLTSLKEEPVRAMLEASVSEVLGLHPLFGPGEPSMAGQNIVLCPARGGRWLSWIQELLKKNGACLVEATPQRHDQIMAFVQAGNHLHTILLGLILQEAGLEPAILECFSTPVLRTKMGLIRKVISQPTLYAEIITRNPEIMRMASLLEGKIAELMQATEKRSAEKLTKLMKKIQASLGSPADEVKEIKSSRLEGRRGIALSRK
jgi:prephenate dehydrogenase